MSSKRATKRGSSGATSTRRPKSRKASTSSQSSAPNPSEVVIRTCGTRRPRWRRSRFEQYLAVSALGRRSRLDTCWCGAQQPRLLSPSRAPARRSSADIVSDDGNRVFRGHLLKRRRPTRTRRVVRAMVRSRFTPARRSDEELARRDASVGTRRGPSSVRRHRRPCQCGWQNPYPCCGQRSGNATMVRLGSPVLATGGRAPGVGQRQPVGGQRAGETQFCRVSTTVTDAVSCRTLGTYGHVALP